MWTTRCLGSSLAVFSVMACGPVGEAESRSKTGPGASEQARTPSEAVEAFDPTAAHRDAYAKARPSIVALASALASATLPLRTPQRRELDEALRESRQLVEGIDASRLEPRAANELKAMVLLAERAESLLTGASPDFRDVHQPARTLEGAIACAERHLSRGEEISESCTDAWENAGELLSQLVGTTASALDDAKARLARSCARLKALQDDEAWQGWASAQRERCERLRTQIGALKFGGDPAEPAPWTTLRRGSNRDGELVRFSELPARPTLAAWFRLSSGWAGAERKLLPRAQQSLLGLQMKTPPRTTSKSTPFSESECERFRTAMTVDGDQAGTKTAAIDCAALQRAARGRDFLAGEQHYWSVRRLLLDAGSGGTSEDTQILGRLDSPAAPVSLQLAADLLSAAGLDEGALYARQEAIDGLCRGMVLAAVLADMSQPQAPRSCPAASTKAALADPLGALYQLELAFLDFTTPVGPQLINGHWLPMGWRAMQSQVEGATAPLRGPVIMKTEINESAEDGPERGPESGAESSP